MSKYHRLDGAVHRVRLIPRVASPMDMSMAQLCGPNKWTYQYQIRSLLHLLLAPLILSYSPFFAGRLKFLNLFNKAPIWQYHCQTSLGRRFLISAVWDLNAALDLVNHPCWTWATLAGHDWEVAVSKGQNPGCKGFYFLVWACQSYHSGIPVNQQWLDFQFLFLNYYSFDSVD